ncbi:MAG: ribose 5-phosphate isomerase B [Planctomycetes bacterium]|nr:ribose 5-phosphate isomerase B [Planctomycetota bacterium]
MRIYAASDHAGFSLKKALVTEARRFGHEVTDLGPDDEQRVDYPDFAAAVGRAVAGDPGSRGLICCGTGIGVCIAANKVPGVRCAVVWDEATARLSREHNDANVLAIGGRLFSVNDAVRMLDVWLTTNFEGGRHAERVEKIRRLEDEARGG